MFADTRLLKSGRVTLFENIYSASDFLRRVPSARYFRSKILPKMKNISVGCGYFTQFLLSIVLVMILSASGCSADPDKNILDDASKLGSIRFQSPPRVIMAHENSSWSGDAALELVVEIAAIDTDAFKRLSGLDNFSPGVPQGWVEDYWKEKHLSDDLKSSNPTEVEHVSDSQPRCSIRRVVMQQIENPTMRIYVALTCF